MITILSTMKMRIGIWLIGGILLGSFLSCASDTAPSTYQPTWQSLSSHPVPNWYREAKFGVFIHWGVYSVPAYHEWYLVFMSPKARFGRNLGGPPYTAAQGDLPDSVFRANIRPEANRYQREAYGTDFAYDDFIPMFKGEQFDPESWAALFKQAGARYVVLTAKHGDEFALWPTEYTRRNAMNMGPHRDLLGDLTAAVRQQGLKMGYYHNTTYSFWDARYPNQEWVDYMNHSIEELVDKYQPDILWGDVVAGPARDQAGRPLGADHWNSKEVIAYFYNHSKNPQEVVTNDRWGIDLSARVNSEKAISRSVWASSAERWGLDAQQGAVLGDFQTPERRNITEIFRSPWETCDSMDPTSWGYNKRLPDAEYMTTNEIVDYLADIVSKGGNLLINIGPKADGTIPAVMQKRLQGVGAWLRVNGEAIYGTHPWETFGEGATRGETGSWGRTEGEYRYTASDIRFTTKGKALYAIVLGWPGDRLTVTSLKSTESSAIQSVSMLGYPGELQWTQTGNGLQIQTPASPSGGNAYIFKIVFRKELPHFASS